MINWLKKAWVFIKKNWKVLLFALLLVALVIQFLVIKKDRTKLAMYNNRVKIVKDKIILAGLKGKRDQLIIDIEKNDGKIVEVDKKLDSIDKDIALVNKRIKNSGKNLDKLTMKEKLKKFKDLGY